MENNDNPSNNNNNDDEVELIINQNAERIIPEHMRIEDIDAWLRLNGLRYDDDDDDLHHHNDLTLDQEEDRNRFQQEAQYQAKIHERFFAKACAIEEQQKQERLKRLETFKNHALIIHTAHGSLDPVPLYPFVKSCETIFAFACSLSLWDQNNNNHNHNNQNNDDDNNNDNNQSSKNNTNVNRDEETKSVCVLEYKLLDYSLHDTKLFTQCVLGTTKVEDLGDNIVDVCCIADYLQNDDIRNEAEEVFKASIDTTNCLSICQLADRLGMPSLFEMSLQHMMRTLGTVEEGSDCWDDLSPELRERILVIKKAIQSSVHSQRNKLYFNNLGEYISIFAERVQYYRERLDEAKDQLRGLPKDTFLYADTESKINKQEQRLRTLTIALEEQKKMFGNNRVVPKPVMQNDGKGGL